MNTQEAYLGTTPFGQVEECAKFVIDDVSMPFILSDVTAIGHEYTFGCWIKSEADGILAVCGTDFSTATEWVKHAVTFTASQTDLPLRFSTAGTYYIYHPKLELGNKATDWTPAPEDVDDSISNVNETATGAQETANNVNTRLVSAESYIQQLADSISMMVTDGNGMSLMTQTEDGWTFNLGQITDTIEGTTHDIDQLTEDMGGIDNTVQALEQAVNDLGVLTDYVAITTYNNQPCIELGEAENDFKLRITNTEIQFIDGSAIPAYLSNQKLNIEKAEIKDELQFGGFVWKIRSNGNMGLMWKGAGE